MWAAFKFIVVLGLLAVAAAWIAEAEGPAVLEWQGWRVETTTGIIIAAALVLAIATALLYRLWLFLRRAPASVGRARRDGRRRRGYLALTRGMVAVAAGDAEEARHQAARAEGLLGDPPLTMLLSAQAAQLAGDERAAERFFRAMIERPETEFLGVRGLLTQAAKRGDHDEALALARRAHRLRPGAEWVAKTLFTEQVRARQWADAETTLAEATRHGLLAGERGRRERAALLHLRSLEAAVGATPGSKGPAAGDALRLARQAFTADPAFVPGAARLAELLLAAGKKRRATAVIEEAWRAHPHPRLAENYARVRPGGDALARVHAIQRLSALNPAHPESHLALARASLAAKLWGEARRHLEALNGAAASAPVYRLMAEIEEVETGDAGRTREWLERAAEATPGPAWVCGECGWAAPEWTALCPKCESFASLNWGRPPSADAEPPRLTAAAARTALPAAAIETA